MVQYRRAQSPGGIFALTFTLNKRGSNLLTNNFDLFKSCYAIAQKRWPFETVAMVVLPDHVHVVWKLPENDGDYSLRIRVIKHLFTRGLIKKGMDFRKRSNGERSCWQRRFWEHQVRDEQDLRNQVDYIHYNPVKHGFVEHVKDWPYSSFHRYVREGKLPMDWGA
jgi:putative transposase